MYPAHTFKEMDRRPSSYKSRPASSKPSGSSCVICFKIQSIYSIGTCDHPVCYECSTTMRVLCDQKECPICRRILTKVIFTKDELDLFKNLEERSYPRYNKKYGIAFGDLSVENSFDQLLRCYCKKCYERPEFTAFEQLATHMERNHRLYACRLCVNNLKIFPSQRRWYNYDELTRHEECGDTDNTSHRGHPECQFCKVRYLDKDELYKHLRKEHFFCHFCDADGIQDYYMTYDWLRKHYFDKHYLCEEGNCINEQYTSVFRTSIDLQAHKAQTHSRDLGKQGYKEARTLKLEFTLRPRHNPTVEAGRPNQYQPPRPRQPPSDYSYNNSYNNNNNYSGGQESSAATSSDRAINVRNTADFPSLNGQHTTVLPCARTRKQNQSVNTRDLHSFPALGQDPQPSVAPKAQKPPVNSIRMAAVLKKPAEPPKPDRNKDAKVPSGPRLPNQARDFPSLDGNQNHQPQQQQQNLQHPRLAANKEMAAASGSGGGSWVSKAKTGNESEKKKVKKEPAAIKKKIAEAPKVPGPSDFPNLNKKYEPSKSNLAKLGGNKKKSENSKKIASAEINVNGSGSGTVQNGKKNLPTVDSNSSNKENCNKPNTKTVNAVQMCNGEIKTATSTNNKAVAGKTEVTKPAAAAPVEVPKREQSKKKESAAVGRTAAQPDEESVSDANNPKDKKKRKKNENRGEQQQQQPTSTGHQQQENHHQQQLQNNYIKTATPKIPPGFENAYQQPPQQQVRAPPGLSGNRGPSPAAQNHHRVKAPPGLSLSDSGGDGGKPSEYLHPVGSSVRNKVLINNLMAALIPARDERFDTFEKFKEMSTLFRKHVITAFDFYSYCVEALAPHSFESVFQELVLLLPDIQKQRELLFIYNRNSRHEMNVEVCKHCRQVLKASELESHQSVHSSTARS
ncbi:E3 ubiquitin-protein ligase ZNF598 isoform X1 [Metopolophium dirhodum]|uniref:E3 ubiquitin-protein ligase ZNF598 isoform X1 n=2 Tax=Metopolophium dirhodum TaxID=44670 RepID=UPI00299023AE|nr:E3 ubiquitin-protein ligase ZNF598 isoform X1 [Metopolophium dirhodum]